ncbi:hypothetical protein Pla163_07170 [Planctomycetes bacterium Pla163]|uniref:Uncharacterized protein n=1 Tax=Rohdeia mirabilis TaxID=2528008 RepID=A0A518CWP7_9BACT|nr:hypothetical protein Pla163_07170 [Planctomycetes bacterium Pla163]
MRPIQRPLLALALATASTVGVTAAVAHPGTTLRDALAAFEEFAFGPVPGQRVEKEFEVTTKLDLDSASLVVDGEYEDVPIEMSTRTISQLSVRDEYAEVGGGRPLRIERQYISVGARATADSRTPTLGGGDIEVEHASALEGRGVRFQWDPATTAYTRRFSDETSEPDDEERALLDGLDEDLDLRGWLPGDSVDEGDRWLVEPAVLRAALRPGGDLGLAPTDAAAAERLGAFDRSGGLAGLLGTPTGTIEGKLLHVRGPAGARVATMEFTIDVRFFAELSGESWPAFVDPAPPGDEEVKVTVSSTELDALADRGVATLVWDVDGGRFVSFDLDLTLDLRATQDLVLSLGEEKAPVRMELSWTLAQRLEAASKAL